MTREDFEGLNYNDRKEFCDLLGNWLGHYTDAVIEEVLPLAYDIYENEHAMRLLRELRDREQKERHDIANTIELNLRRDSNEKYYQCHLHCLTHADAYREVLYDMYIKDRPRKEDK